MKHLISGASNAAPIAITAIKDNAGETKTLNLLKKAILFVLLGLGIASCSKGDSPISSSNKPPVDYHQTAATQFITADGTKFAYRILGNKSGTPLVMISSLGSTMDDWDPAVTNGLAQQYKVIIFDIQGVGTSGGLTPDNIPDMAKGVVAFINALGYSKVNLLGFSMGSFISQQIVLTDPGLVNKIILTGTGPKGSEGLANLPNLLSTVIGLSPEDFLLKSQFTSSAASIAAGKLAFERMQKRVVDRDAPVNNTSLTAEIKAVLGWAQPYPDAVNELKKVTQPVFIAQGQDDILVPVINAVNMSHSIAGARLTVYPDAGHAAIFQYHDEFVQTAIDFLGK